MENAKNIGEMLLDVLEGGQPLPQVVLEELEQDLRILAARRDTRKSIHGDRDFIANPLLLAGDSELPSADELGAELERFLAEQPQGGDGSA